MSIKKLDNQVFIEGYDPSKQVDENEKFWRDIYNSAQNEMILQGEAIGIETLSVSATSKKKTNCLILESGDVRGIIPYEYAGVQHEREFNRLIGRTVAFKVVNIDRENNVFVGSRKAAKDHMASLTWKQIQEGQVVQGVVKDAFQRNLIVDVGGIEVSVPVREVVYDYVAHLGERYGIGDYVQALVTKLDRENEKIELSIKATKPNPWDQAAQRYKVKSEYVGRVSGVEKYGVFVSLPTGVSAFSPHLKHETLWEGDKVAIRILEVLPQEEKIKSRIVRKLD